METAKRWRLKRDYEERVNVEAGGDTGWRLRLRRAVFYRREFGDGVPDAPKGWLEGLEEIL